MGIGFVLILYLIVFSIAAAIAAFLLLAATRWYLRDATGSHKKALSLVGVFPFACVAFAGVWFLAYAVISDSVFHHDPMIGDGWYTELGNGYAIDMIDVTDFGYLHPSGSRNGSSPIDGVRRLQVVGNEVFGALDTQTAQEFGTDRRQENVFFAFNTKALGKREFTSESELRAFAKQKGIELNLEPILDVYREHRSISFDWIAGVLLITVEAGAFLLLVRYVHNLRSSHGITTKELAS